MDTIYHKNNDECPPGMHDTVPIIEGNETVGLVCISCGWRLRENMERSSLLATDKGLIDTRQRPPSRKDPRF